jgi:hypothetical protein
MAACVRLAMVLLLVLAVLILYGDLALRIAHRTRTATTLKVVSIDSEWQHCRLQYTVQKWSQIYFFCTGSASNLIVGRRRFMLHPA